MTIKQTSFLFDCTFLREVSFAEYLQYTCISPIPDTQLRIIKKNAKKESFGDIHSFMQYFAFKLGGLALNATVDITYWKKTICPQNLIRLSSLELCNVCNNASICPAKSVPTALLELVKMSDGDFKCCFFKKGIPKCPRNDEDIIPDEVAEYLARQAYRHGFEKCSYIRHPYISTAHS
nr:unnamed protein product [Spirometra erinaceieuropaei]